MSTQLTRINSLQLNENGVWINPGQSSDFGYSDGADEELYLIDVLETAQDVSLDSAALRQACRDWVASYHLSAVRANLLKTLKLPATAKVLEVGCGCGALSRYLGEQAMQVDAVEGSGVRAQIAALRCRDLDNVQIIEHNFNTLDLPQNHYDAVLFIGVLEYAGRFIDTPGLTSEQAVMTLLNKAAVSVKDSGVIVVAIENRTGLKYEDGAFEDHLAIPNVGIENYEGYDYTGIKTYDHCQWQTLIEDCGLLHRLYYPFADYKFPGLVINGEIDNTAVDYLANTIRSHDPISPWQPLAGEHEKWSAIINSNLLGRSSNSFGIIIAKTQQAMANRFTCNWTVFDNVAIKKGLRIDINNEKANKYNNNNEIKQCFNKLPYNSLWLSNHWRIQLTAHPSRETVMRLTRELAIFIGKDWPQQRLIDHDQLYICDENHMIEYVKAWELPIVVSSSQQIFHYLLGFCNSNQKFISSLPAFHYTRVSDLIADCLLQLTTDHCQSLKDLIKQEQWFRQQVMIYPISVEDELACMFSNHDMFQYGHVSAQLFWSTDGLFTADQSCTQRIKQTGGIQQLNFNNIESANRHLRFDPCDHEYGNGHVLQVISFKLTDVDGHVLITPDHSGIHDLQMIDQDKNIYRVNGIDPQIKFSLSEDLTKITDRYNVEIKLQWLGC